MLKLAIALLSTLATSSFALAQASPMHVAYGCQDAGGQRVTLSMEKPEHVLLIDKKLGQPLDLGKIDQADGIPGYETFSATLGCGEQGGFARCFSLRLIELQISPELQQSEIAGKAFYGGTVYSCHMNMM